MSDCARCRELESIINHLRDRLEMRQISDMWNPDEQLAELQRLRRVKAEMDQRCADLEGQIVDFMRKIDRQGTEP